jgi:hypothetical protein
MLQFLAEVIMIEDSIPFNAQKLLYGLAGLQFIRGRKRDRKRLYGDV